MKLIPITLLLLLLTACAAAPDLTPAATATLAGTPLPTATPTIAPSPTPNERATIAAVELQTAQEYAAAKQAEVNGEIELERMRQDGNARAASAQMTLEAERGNTARAEAIRQAEINRAAEIEIEREKAATDAALAEKRVFAENALALAALVGVVGVVAALLIRAWRHGEYQGDDEADDEPELPAYPGGLSIRLFVPSIPPEILIRAAQAYASGVPFTHDAMTPEHISEGRFATLQHLLVKYGGAAWNDEERHQNGCTITPKGERFFADLLGAPPPHRRAMSPSGANQPTERQTDSDFGGAGDRSP